MPEAITTVRALIDSPLCVMAPVTLVESDNNRSTGSFSRISAPPLRAPRASAIVVSTGLV